jgi:hypothetical protein
MVVELDPMTTHSSMIRISRSALFFDGDSVLEMLSSFRVFWDMVVIKRLC